MAGSLPDRSPAHRGPRGSLWRFSPRHRQRPRRSRLLQAVIAHLAPAEGLYPARPNAEMLEPRAQAALRPSLGARPDHDLGKLLGRQTHQYQLQAPVLAAGTCLLRLYPRALPHSPSQPFATVLVLGAIA